MIRRVLTIGAVLGAFLAAPAAASLPGGMCVEDFRNAVMGPESGGNYSVLNTITGSAAGAYQFIPVALADLGYVSRTNPSGGYSWSNVAWTGSARSAGVSSLDDFLHTAAGHALQDRAFEQFTRNNWSRLSSGSRGSVGQTVGGVQITEGGLLSAAHFLGAGGLNNFIANGFNGSNLNNLSAILAQNGFSSVAQLNNYVMSRLSSGAAAHSGECGASVAAGAGLGRCFEVSTLPTDPEYAMSPFGIDRTGRTRTGGVHLGLDMVGGSRGAPVLAGVPGEIILARPDATNSVFMLVEGGQQQVGFLHGDSIFVEQGQTVASTDQVIDMGARGAGAAVHLHLYVALRGDVIAQAAEAAGTVWPQSGAGNYWGNKRGTSMTGAVLRSAAPEAFYMVNPETFLHHRIPWNPGILTVQQYIDQGFVRPDGMTLEPTCGPSAETFDRGGLASVNGGVVPGDGFANGGTAANLQQSANLASSDARDAVLEGAEYTVAMLQARQQRQRGAAFLSSAWAGMALAVMEGNY